MAQLLQNTAYGTVLILAVVILRRVLKDRLLPGARLALWAVCLFRLLTPAAPESVLSLWGLSRLFEQPEQAAPTRYVTGYLPAAAAPAPQTAPGISWETVLLTVWLVAGVVLAARYLLSWTRTRRAVACAIPLDRSDERYTPLPKCARLREGPMEGAPLTFGAVRPTVVLSPGLDGTELDCVLAHEGVHARRRDNLWHYAMALALVVHWWNPAVWLMSRLLRRDIELSCDRAAVRRLGEERRAEYAQALVSLATQADGPAFCHTFGRKAAEERILSIMKFKKTSIIGVIFSLALVLAVTAAFASEPKEPDGTVVFHDQTFSRAELSQETLDWLDWYFTLPEEEQLAVSYVPAELNRGRDTDTQDADDMVPLPDKTKDIQSAFPEVDPDDVNLSKIKEMLAKKVADGEITQEEADQRLAATEQMLDQARRGELKLFLYDNGEGENWFYGAGVFQVNGEMKSQFVDPGQVLQPLYYKDENGKLVPMDPDTVVRGYVLGDSSSPDLPTYVEEGEDISETLGQLLGEADIKYDEGKTAQDYNVKLPAFDKDGNPVSADGSIVGSRSYDYVIETDPNVTEFGSVGQRQMELEEYKALLNKLVTEAKMTRRGADSLYASAKRDLEKGKFSVLYANETGGYAIMGAPLCDLADCKDYEPHSHGAMKYSGHVTFPCPVENCQNGGSHYHDGVCYLGTLPICDFPGCAISGVHTHDDGVTYKGQTAKQPAPSAASTPVPSAAPAPSQPIPCPVEGCTIAGSHTHNGVTYLCNGYHCGGVCDGTCNTSNDLPQYPGNGGHHGWDHSSGHHGNGHH